MPARLRSGNATRKGVVTIGTPSAMVLPVDRPRPKKPRPKPAPGDAHLQPPAGKPSGIRP
ncbi:MAG: hypothetical protein FJZ01_04850 [Candidatus Sericytochromatia bacterium]|nr:hypothetical protein [Candidatus Tanganyikabacteria bacterium]